MRRVTTHLRTRPLPGKPLRVWAEESWTHSMRVYRGRSRTVWHLDQRVLAETCEDRTVTPVSWVRMQRLTGWDKPWRCVCDG